MSEIVDDGSKCDWRSATISLLGENLFVRAELRSREDFDRWTDRLFATAEILWPSEAAGAAQVDSPPAEPAKPPLQPPIGGRDGLPALTFDAALHALRGFERRAKMLEFKERGHTDRQIAVAFGSTEGAVSVACSNARKERARASADA